MFCEPIKNKLLISRSFVLICGAISLNLFYCIGLILNHLKDYLITNVHGMFSTYVRRGLLRTEIPRHTLYNLIEASSFEQDL